MLTFFHETWSLEAKLDRRAFGVPSGYPGAAVRLSLAEVAGSLTAALKVQWRDAGGTHDFATARTLDATTTNLLLSADDMQGVSEVVVINPISQAGVIVSLTAGIETPSAPIPVVPEPPSRLR